LGLLLLLAINTACRPQAITLAQQPAECDIKNKHWDESECTLADDQIQGQCQDSIAACCKKGVGCVRYQCGAPGVQAEKDCPLEETYLACCDRNW
jgi:hypothetical protein